MRILAGLLLLLLLAPTAAAESKTIDIEAGSHPDGTMYLKPDAIHVNLGDEITFRVHNPDRIFHDVALLDYDGEDIEIEVPAGRTVSNTFNATQAGEYRLICEVTGHKQKGMQGTLTVTDPNAKTPLTPLLALAALSATALLLRRRP